MAKQSTQNSSSRRRARRLYRQAVRLERKGTPGHMDEAATLLRQAVRLGSGASALKLAEIHLNEDFPNLYDPEAAVKLLRRLADRGNTSACFMLGRQLHKQGEDKDAVKYLTHASNRENIPARALLGEMRLKGDGVMRDVRQGVRLLSGAAQAGNTDAQLILAKAYHSGKILRENPERSAYWTKRAALLGDEYAQLRMAVHCFCGYGTDRDSRECYFWMRQAARQGYAPAQANVGECLQEGLGVRQNESKGVKYYAKAAAQGFLIATTRLGLCYILGRGVREDKQKGVSMLREAAKKGYEYAASYLVLFGRLNHISLAASEIELYERQLREAGHAISLSDEPAFPVSRKHNWIEGEYERIERIQSEYVFSEDDEFVPGLIGRLLKFRELISALFSGMRGRD